MTEMYYYKEPYAKSISATVTAVTPKGLYLSRTVSYPEGGGQPGDRGWIEGVPYSDTLHEGDEILHVMKDTSRFKAGDSVTITLDWEHRYDYMQQHTAQHLLSGLMFTNHGIGTLSVHQGEDILTIETDRGEIGEDVLLKLEDEANSAINEGHRVYYREMSHSEAEGLGLRRSIKVDGDVRIVVIEGVDMIACGGIHTASTSEIGEISYAGSEMIRGHVRTIWRTGERAKAKRRSDAALVKGLSALLSAREDSILAAAERLAEENRQLKGTLKAAEEKGAEIMLASGCDSLFSSPYPLSAFQPHLKDGEYFITHTESGRTGWLFFGGQERFALLKKEAASLGLKGGGRAPLFQGVSALSEEALLESVREILR